MVVGARCECETCGFEFCSGHSHHTGTRSAVCTHCVARYELPSKSIWGPDFDESIELHRVTEEPGKRSGKKKHRLSSREISLPTSQHVVARADASGRYIELHHVEQLKCVECQRVGSIQLHFNSQDPCPKCRQGRLDCVEVLYQGTAKPTARRALASQMSGMPTMAVGSSVSMRSNSVIPKASALNPPAQSKGFSRSM
jgi:hypothetical protein